MTCSESESSETTISPSVTAFETTLELLANEQRRLLLLVLQDSTGRISLDELARSVAARANEDTSLTDSGPSTDQVAISLHHNHLPKLDDAGIVDYDVDRREAELGVDPWPLDRLLDDVRFARQ